MASGKHGHTIRLAGSTTGIAAPDTCPGDLGTAIVHRACVDYLSALRGRTHHGHDRLDSREQLEKFFHSRWFGYLCGADPDAIIYALRRLHKAGKKSIHYGIYSNNREEQ